MQLSTKGRYAVMAMVDLACHGSGSSVPLASIAERQHISVAYLEQLCMNRCSVEGHDWCLGTKRCATHDLWRALGIHISTFLGAISLKDVLDGTLAGPGLDFSPGEPVVKAGPKQRVVTQ